MSTSGADVEQLRKAAQMFRQKADYLESSVSQGVSHQIDTSQWKGSDAQSFHHQWQSDLAPKIRQVAAALRTNADALTRNAAEQEKASATSGGATGGGGAATGGGTHSHGRDFLQETSDAIGWSKVPSFCWDVTDKVIEHINMGREAFNRNPSNLVPKSLIKIKGAGIIGGVFRGFGVIGSVNDVKNFWNALNGGTDYDKLSTGVDAVGGLLQHAPFLSPPHVVGTALKTAKALKEEVDKTVSSGPWPQGVSVFDAMAEGTGEKPAKDFIGRASQVIRGGAMTFGGAVLTTIGKIF
ncbi:WXG100 family type VII secretion target [uncultured Actinomyces sp.]|uniref:WXG100 family type VII secretion target n=1 Tax=uncultured Actinomyces sp. TaxID=249061 RepID=UPI0028E681E2|nr:WXG100 family type VII secretion target [uncultured Actinomyces sp.]